MMSVLSRLDGGGTLATVELRSERGIVNGGEGWDGSDTRALADDSEGVGFPLDQTVNDTETISKTVPDSLPVTSGDPTHLETEHSLLGSIAPVPGHHGGATLQILYLGLSWWTGNICKDALSCQLFSVCKILRETYLLKSRHCHPHWPVYSSSRPSLTVDSCPGSESRDTCRTRGPGPCLLTGAGHHQAPSTQSDILQGSPRDT